VGLQSFDEVSPVLYAIPRGNSQGTGAQYIAFVSLVTRIDQFSAVSTDTVDVLVQIQIGGQIVDTVKVPAGAGNGTVPAVDLMKALTLDLGLNHIVLPANGALQVLTVAAVSAGKTLTFLATGGTVPAI